VVRISQTKPLVLGSASPRRREILSTLGIAHVVVSGDADEAVRPGENVEDYLPRVVLSKLKAVRAALPEEVSGRAAGILVADTSVVLEEAILGKPASFDEALAMIAQLSGRTHEVMTRFAIAKASDSSPMSSQATNAPDHVETVVTKVTFRSLTVDEARSYAASGEGTDKAGGYAVQGFACAFVSRIRGSYTNVVGLPACEVVLALRALGLT
jgi:septum formation protein